MYIIEVCFNFLSMLSFILALLLVTPVGNSLFKVLKFHIHTAQFVAISQRKL